MRTLFVTVGFLFLSSACGGGGGATPPPDDLEGARLVFISPQNQSLRYGDAAELRVRYEFEDGTPIGGVTLRYEIDGLAAGSTLSAERVSTTDAGEATASVTAGSTETSFRVRVTPPEGDAIEFRVGVADFEAGSIAVELRYAGSQSLEGFEAFLFDVPCRALDSMALPTARVAAPPVTRLTDRPGMTSVPAGDGYSVAVQARIGGEVAGFGCTGDVTVRPAEETVVPVTIDDFEVMGRIVGAYELDNRLDLGGALPPTVERIVDVLAELTDDQDIDGNEATEDYGQDPGAFVVDFAMRQTCHWECLPGEGFDDCSEIDHGWGDISALYLRDFMSWDGAQRDIFGGCGVWETAGKPAQSLVNDQIDDFVPEFILTFAEIAGDLARAINDARITSLLVIQQPTEVGSPISHELLSMEVLLHDLSGAEHTYSFDLADAGFTMLRTDATALQTGDRLDIPEHSFELHYGELLQYVYVEGLLPLLGFTSTEEMLATWIDCRAVGASLAASVGVLSESTYVSACESGLRAGGLFFDEGLAGATDATGTLTLMGTATGADYGTDMIAQSLVDGMWAGSWGESGMTGDVTGTFTGARE